METVEDPRQGLDAPQRRRQALIRAGTNGTTASAPVAACEGGRRQRRKETRGRDMGSSNRDARRTASQYGSRKTEGATDMGRQPEAPLEERAQAGTLAAHCAKYT
jgi:hypothetical protein